MGSYDVQIDVLFISNNKITFIPKSWRQFLHEVFSGDNYYFGVLFQKSLGFFTDKLSISLKERWCTLFWTVSWGVPLHQPETNIKRSFQYQI